MSWKEFIVNIIDSIVWPVIAGAIIFIFRIEITEMISRLAHLKYRDVELDFDRVKQQSQDLQKEVMREKLAIKEPILTSLEDQIKDAVDRAPSVAILLAWSALESAMAATVSRLAISPDSPSYRSSMHNIDMLVEYAGPSKRHANLIHELRMLRNKVAHERHSMILVKQKQALNYTETALNFIMYLEKLSRSKIE